MEITIKDICMVAVVIVSAVLTYVIVPLLKAKYGTEKQEQLLELIMKAVEAAEQIYRGSGMGATKKEYVLSFLHERGYDIEEKEIDNLIEACVHELNKEVKKDE